MLIKLTDKLWIDSESIAGVEIINSNIYITLKGNPGQYSSIPQTDSNYSKVITFLNKAQTINDILAELD